MEEVAENVLLLLLLLLDGFDKSSKCCSTASTCTRPGRCTSSMTMMPACDMGCCRWRWRS